jgi:cell division protein FtsB
MLKIKSFWKRWIFYGLIIILFFMVMGLNSSLSQFFQLTDQRNQMDTRIDNLKATQYALATEIAYAKSDKAVEEWARTYQRDIQPGDQAIIPLSPQEITPQTNYLQTPTPNQEKKWQIWWELFFGE